MPHYGILSSKTSVATKELTKVVAIWVNSLYIQTFPMVDSFLVRSVMLSMVSCLVNSLLSTERLVPFGQFMSKSYHSEVNEASDENGQNLAYKNINTDIEASLEKNSPSYATVKCGWRKLSLEHSLLTLFKEDRKFSDRR